MTGGTTISDKLTKFIEDQKSEATRVSDVACSDVLSRFIEEQRNDFYAWQLILFFSEHPYIRFNRLAVIHALNHESGTRYIQIALDELIEQGIIKVATNGNLPLYSLADNMRELVLKLTRPTKKE
jgi:hypothetical protein